MLAKTLQKTLQKTLHGYFLGAAMGHEDRYLKLYRGRWRYIRRVPKSVAHLDNRGKLEIALGTASIDVARTRRDAMEEADNLYWSSLVTGGDDQVDARYEAAKARAKALGFSYRSLDDLVGGVALDELAKRVLSLQGKSGQRLETDMEAVLGRAPVPRLTLSKALDIFLEKCAAEELSRKSINQIKAYKKVKTRAVKNFIALIGDKPIDTITRDDAVRFHDWWQDRVTGKKGQKRLSGNSANRDIGNLRRIYREVYARLGQADRKNPFDRLSFDDPKRLKQDVPPFPVAWIRDRLLRADSYAPVEGRFRALNPDTLKIFLTVIETGCRPSEICNLADHRIHLDHPVPHIEVDFDDSREIKTEASTRKIPLVGIALEAMKRAPAGFPRYMDKENSFSATMMRHLRKRGLLPSDHHIVYSVRHSFEDRLKEGGVDYEMRCRLLGHAINRPDYGEGGSLEYRRNLLKKIALPFDPALLDLIGRPHVR